MHGRINRRMGAHEQQFEPLIWKLGGQASLGVFLRKRKERRLALRNHSLMTSDVDDRIPRRCQQPSGWILRKAILWPHPQRLEQGLAQRVLRGGNIVCIRRKVSYQPAVRFASYALDGPAGVLLINPTHPVNPRRLASGASGRISTAPSDAPGHRAAQPRAASTEGSSRTMIPANCSLVSA